MITLINYIRSLYKKDLGKILGLFDKAHAEITKYIDEAKAEAAALEGRLGIVNQNVATAEVAQATLTAITSAPNVTYVSSD